MEKKSKSTADVLFSSVLLFYSTQTRQHGRHPPGTPTGGLLCVCAPFVDRSYPSVPHQAVSRSSALHKGEARHPWRLVFL